MTKQLEMVLIKQFLLLIVLWTTSAATAANTGADDGRWLQRLYASTNGSGWYNTDPLSSYGSCNSGWVLTTGANPCSGDSSLWNPRIRCFSGRVYQVILSDCNLRGSLPELDSSTSPMSQLLSLDLSNNKLNGSLPSSFGSLPNLLGMYLYSNQLNGTLPSSWSSLASLLFMYLHENQLSGPLPDSWGSLSSLQMMYLYGNQLNGTLPSSWSSLIRLQQMYLYSNQLNGTLPSLWCSLSSLQIMYLQENELSGPLPSSWSSLSSVQIMYLCDNELNGTLPSSWSNLHYLQQLHLHGNQLSGPLPESWGSLSSLQKMYLYENQLNGTLPSSWSSLSSLQIMYLFGNQLNGTLPSLWSSLSSLQQVLLYGNQLNGSLPSSWSSLSSLQIVLLNKNRLSGPLPSSWSSLSRLQIMYLCDNELNGTLPSSFGNLSNLLELHLHNNHLTGGFPSSWVRGLANLTFDGLLLFSNCLDMYVSIDSLSWLLSVSLFGAGLIPQYTNCSVVLCAPGRVFRHGVCSTDRTLSSSPTVSELASWSASSSTSGWGDTASSTGTEAADSHSAFSSSASPPTSWSSTATMSTSRQNGHTTLSKKSRMGAPTSINKTPSSSLFLSDASAASTSPSSPITTTTTMSLVRRRSESQKLHQKQPLTSSSSLVSGSRSLSPSTQACDPVAACRVASLSNVATSEVTANISCVLLLAAAGEAARWMTAAVSAADVRRVMESSAVNTCIFLLPVDCSGDNSVFSLPFHGNASSFATVAMESGAGIVQGTTQISVVGSSWNSAAVFMFSGIVSGLDRVGTPMFWYSSGLRLVVDFEMECGGTAARVSVTVPIAPDTLPLPQQAAAAVISTVQWTATFSSGASAAASVGRVAATRRLVLCSGAVAAGDGGLLGLRVGPSGCDWVPLARGSIVGNTIVLMCGALLLLCLGVLWSRTHYGASIVQRMCLPSSLLGLWTSTIPSTSAAVMMLMFPPAPSCVGSADALVVIIGVVEVVVPLVALVGFAAWGPEAALGVVLQRRFYPNLLHQEGIKVHIVWRLWAVAMKRQWQWRPAPENQRRLTDSEQQMGVAARQRVEPHRMANAVLREYRVVWYASIETGLLAVLSCFATLGTLVDSKACRGLAVAVIIMIAVQLVVCAVVRPFTTHFSYAYGCVTLLLSLLSASMQLMALTQLTASDTAALNAVAVCGAVCDMMCASLGMMKMMLTDVPSAAKGAMGVLRESVDECCGLREREAFSKWDPQLDSMQLQADSQGAAVPLCSNFLSDIDIGADEQIISKLTRQHGDAATTLVTSLEEEVNGDEAVTDEDLPQLTAKWSHAQTTSLLMLGPDDEDGDGKSHPMLSDLLMM